jgi:hypothetical protein
MDHGDPLREIPGAKPRFSEPPIDERLPAASCAIDVNARHTHAEIAALALKGTLRVLVLFVLILVQDIRGPIAY